MRQALGWEALVLIREIFDTFLSPEETLPSNPDTTEALH